MAEANAIRRTPAEYLSIVWRRRVLVLIVTLSSLAIMIGIDSVRTPVYSSTAKVSFGGKVTSASVISGNIIRLGSAAAHAEAYKLLGQALPPITLRQEGSTAVVDITCTASSASLASRGANALADGYNAMIRAQTVTNALSTLQFLQTSVGTTNTQIAGLNQAIAKAGKHSVLGQIYAKSLQSAYQHLQNLNQQMLFVNSVIVNPPNALAVLAYSYPNNIPLSPKPTTDALLAFLVGILLAVGIAVLQESLDDRLRNRAELEHLAGGRPAIGLIPTIREWEDRKTPLLITAEQPRGRAAEAFRTLRTSLQFMSLDDPIKTLLISSPSAADGKTTVSSNLAFTIAASGQEVIIVGLDLRKPRIHEFFGVSNDVGITSVLLGEVDLDSAIVNVPGSAYLRILPAGPVPPNPAELLSGRRAQQLIGLAGPRRECRCHRARRRRGHL